MKRFLLLLLAVLFVLSFAACSDNTSENASSQESEEAQSDENSAAYDAIIENLKNGNFDYAISEVNRLKNEAIKAENAEKNIREINITVDNWSEYFDFGYSYTYYINSFDEIDYMNVAYGLKLKDEYKLVQDDMDRDTDVNFEAVMSSYESEVTYDFVNGTSTHGELGKLSESEKVFTNRYTDSVYMETDSDRGDGVMGIGRSWQGVKTDGEIQTEHVWQIDRITRAEGTLYIYE